jgi:UDP-N-acetylmuramoyl-L-alanyl-D-glutamate--2,6-diaminopimelate ligase
MKASELIKGLKIFKISGDLNTEIDEVTYDSRKVKKGSLFICNKGAQSDGHLFIPNALNNEASGFVISDNNYFRKNDKLTILVEDTRKAMAILSWNLYGKVWERLDIIGITGTNGKTSTALILDSIMQKNGLKTGLIGTIFYIVDGKQLKADRTTPESSNLGQLFHKMEESGAKAIVMEITSHALVLDRVHGIHLKRAVFTNLTHDHLDFHENIDNYRKAKFKIFDMVEDDKDHKTIIVNEEDPSTKLVPGKFTKKLLTFGSSSQADIFSSELELTSKGTKFKLHTPTYEISVESSLIGKTAVYNILAAASVAYSLDFEPKIIYEGIKDITNIPGRLEHVIPESDFDIYIDYAHTPDALMRVLLTLKEICIGRIITVFGCGGNRDKAKRPIMGSIAAIYSDFSIITNDNPRSEDPMLIIEEIKEGFTNEGSENFVIESDRAKAIEYALRNAKKSDVVLIAGKGHETYQIVGNKVLDFNDKNTVIDLYRRSK